MILLCPRLCCRVHCRAAMRTGPKSTMTASNIRHQHPRYFRHRSARWGLTVGWGCPTAQVNVENYRQYHRKKSYRRRRYQLVALRCCFHHHAEILKVIRSSWSCLNCLYYLVADGGGRGDARKVEGGCWDGVEIGRRRRAANYSSSCTGGAAKGRDGAVKSDDAGTSCCYRDD